MSLRTEEGEQSFALEYVSLSYLPHQDLPAHLHLFALFRNCFLTEFSKITVCSSSMYHKHDTIKRNGYSPIGFVVLVKWLLGI